MVERMRTSSERTFSPAALDSGAISARKIKAGRIIKCYANTNHALENSARAPDCRCLGPAARNRPRRTDLAGGGESPQGRYSRGDSHWRRIERAWPAPEAEKRLHPCRVFQTEGPRKRRCRRSAHCELPLLSCVRGISSLTHPTPRNRARSCRRYL